MQIIIFAHPKFLNSESMPRFAKMLDDGFTALGHQTKVARPKAIVQAIFEKTRLAKWAGYIDQYVLFPFYVKYLDVTTSPDAVFVLADQALGPWARYIKKHRIVAHCLDLLAMKSALGVYEINPVRTSGRFYQRYLRWGYQACHHFICISNRTAEDLERYGNISRSKSSVVYLGLNYAFRPLQHTESVLGLAQTGLKLKPDQYLLFVGGGQWYKNREGLLHMYARYAEITESPLPLVCVSPQPDATLLRILQTVPHAGAVHFIQKIESPVLEALYSAAAVTLFPSHAEGYGWPIIESQACGSPVITTDDSPMNEIAGPAATLIPKITETTDMNEWADHFAKRVAQVTLLDASARERIREAGFKWTAQFQTQRDLEQYVEIYAQGTART